MKKLLYLFIATILFSCDRELEYGSDFDFEVRNMIETPVFINSLKPFQLEIVNKVTMEENNSYTLSYTAASGNFTLKKGIETLIQGIEYPVTSDALESIDLGIIALDDDEIIVEFVLKDHNNIVKRKQILVTPQVLATPFTLTKVNDFTLKNTKQVNFQFTLTGVVTTNTYEIKFITNNVSKIFKTSGEEMSRNTWLPLTLIPTNLYTFAYNALSDTNDVLEIQIRDNFGQVQSINFNVTIFAKPSLTNFNIQFQRDTPTQTSLFWSVAGYTKHNLMHVISGGATLSKTRILIKNKLTNVIDTLEFSNSNVTNTLETVLATSSSSSQALTNCYNQAKYAGQLYSIQIMDSDNVWSDLYNGTVISI